MKTAFYQPALNALVNIQDRPFHHRDMQTVVRDLVGAARRMFGPVPRFAFCVWDESSLRIFPMNQDQPPTFEEVATLVRKHGFRDQDAPA